MSEKAPTPATPSAITAQPTDVSQPLTLLGGLSATQFMRRHWQKRPLLVRQAIPGFEPLLGRPALFDMALREDVESRLIIQQQVPRVAPSPASGTAKVRRTKAPAVARLENALVTGSPSPSLNTLRKYAAALGKRLEVRFK